VYDGIFHLFLSPEDLIPVIALALLAGQRGALSSRRVLWILPVAWFTGGFVGMFIGTPHGSALTCLSFLVLGGLIAANGKISVRLITALAAILGFFHGYLNGSGINRYNDGAYFLVGLALAVFVVVALFTSFVIPLRRQWALIVVRVAGSWIAASGLLMLGWALR
jgi:urease accessory protein